MDAAKKVDFDRASSNTEEVEVIGRSGVQGQGPFMDIVLVCSKGCVERAHFETYGCPSAIRCGDWIARWAPGREAATLQVLEPADLMVVVGGLPLGKEFCAEMAVSALRDGLRQIIGVEGGADGGAAHKAE